MTTLKIEIKNKEIEIYEKDGHGLITIDLVRNDKIDYQFVSIDLNQNQIKQIIEFLQKQI